MSWSNHLLEEILPLVVMAKAPPSPFIVCWKPNGHIKAIHSMGAPTKHLRKFDLLPWSHKPDFEMAEELAPDTGLGEDTGSLRNFGKRLVAAKLRACFPGERTLSTTQAPDSPRGELAQRIVIALPTVRSIAIGPENTCIICREAYTSDDVIVLLPCSGRHYLHTHCSQSSFTHATSCPMCWDTVIPISSLAQLT